MDERSQILLSTLLGAVAGAVVGCLYLTERGGRVRKQIEPALDSFVAEIDRARGTVHRAREAVREGRRAFEDVMAVARATESNGDMESESARPRVHEMSS